MALPSPRRLMRRASVATVGMAMIAFAGLGTVPQVAAVTFHPAVSDFQFLGASTTPPTEADCFSVGRRCFTPTSLQNSYNLGPLFAAGNKGQGMTIEVVDSCGSYPIAGDLNNFNTQMGLPHMCGEPGVTCAPGMPTFSQLKFGNVNTTGQPPNNGTGQ